METRKIGILAGLAGALGYLVQHVPGWVIGRWAADGFEGAVPLMGTIGRTQVIYSSLTTIAGTVILFGIAVGLGYYVGQRVDLATDYRRVGGAIALGSVGGVILGLILIFAILNIQNSSSSSSWSTFYILFVVLAISETTIEVALPITVGAIAGGALAQFRANDNTPPGPAQTETDTPADSPSPSPPENSHG